MYCGIPGNAGLAKTQKCYLHEADDLKKKISWGKMTVEEKSFVPASRTDMNKDKLLHSTTSHKLWERVQVFLTQCLLMSSKQSVSMIERVGVGVWA